MTQYLIEEAAMFALDAHDARMEREAMENDSEQERLAARREELVAMAQRARGA